MTARSSRRSRSTAASRRGGRLPRNAPLQLQITHVGGRGDGVGRASYTHQYRTAEHHVFVPATLAWRRGDCPAAIAWRSGVRCLPQEILTPSAERREPDCDAFPACGGCTFQHWQDDPAIAWKAAQLDGFLARAGVAPATRLDAHISPRHSRRRATSISNALPAVWWPTFWNAAPAIVTPAGCSVLRPELVRMLPRLAEIAERYFPVGLTIDAAANCLDNGICLLLRGPEGWHDGLLEMLATWADDTGLARLSVAIAGGRTGEDAALTIYAPAPPTLSFGGIAITPPPGGFLQATIEAEKVMQADIAGFAATAGIAGSGQLVDFFAGCGTLGLPLLAGGMRVLAADRTGPRSPR